MSAADRGAWRLVAVRDFWVRLRERSFLISTLLNVAVISVLVLARASGGLGGAPSFDLGVVGGPDELAIANAAAARAHDASISMQVEPFETAADAEAALRGGSVDAVLSPGQLAGMHGIDATLIALVQTSAHAAAVDAVFQQHHVPQAQREAASNDAPLDVGVLDPPPPHRDDNAAIAFIGVLLLYGQLFGYGLWVATGVIEEKASRVVEILLATIRARQLLAGKILGIGTLGMLQLIVIAAYSIVLASLTGALDFPAHALGTAALAIGWFMLGFAFYASLFAVAGSLVSRMEELQNVIVPLNLVILVSFFLAIGATSDPNSTLSVIVSIVPFSSALAMPVRISLGAAAPFEIVTALVVSIGSTALLIPLAGRIYSGAVLRTGARVKLRDAWRSASN